MESAPFLAAPRLNARTHYAIEFYKRRYLEKLKQATEAGIVGRERARGPQAEFEAIAARLPLLQQVVLDPERHEGQRLRAQREIMRGYKLRQELYGA